MARYAAREHLYECSECDIRFALREALDVATVVESQAGAVECPRCYNWIYDTQLEQRMETSILIDR